MRDRRLTYPLALAAATALTYVCNPFLFSVIGFVAVAHFVGASAMETTSIAVVALVFFKVIPLAILASMVRTGQIDSVEVRSRERRTRPFLLGMASMATGCAVFLVIGTDASRLIATLGAVSVLSAGILTAITLRWKISIHASGAGAFAGLAVFFALNAHAVQSERLDPQLLVFAALALLPAVGWARVHVNAHTPAEVVAGSAFGFIMSIAPLYWLLAS